MRTVDLPYDVQLERKEVRIFTLTTFHYNIHKRPSAILQHS